MESDLVAVWLRLEDDGVRRSGLPADEAGRLLVERLRSVEVARLERDEVGPVAGMMLLLAGGLHGPRPPEGIVMFVTVDASTLRWTG